MRKPRRRSAPKQDEAPPVQNGELIPPGGETPGGIPPALYAAIIAQVNQYTDRPDLLIETIERHDPGFIKAMNEESREFSRESRRSKFNFGRFQAYTSVAVQVAAAAVVLYVLYRMAENNHLTIWLLIGLGVLFAITQSGVTGFLRIAGQVSKLIPSKDAKK